MEANWAAVLLHLLSLSMPFGQVCNFVSELLNPVFNLPSKPVSRCEESIFIIQQCLRVSDLGKLRRQMKIWSEYSLSETS